MSDSHAKSLAAASRPGPLTEAALRALDDAAVDWCLLRGERDLYQSGHATALLVSPPHLGRARSALSSSGYAAMPAGRDQARHFMAYDPREDSWSTLELVSELSFASGSLPAVAAAGCLTRRRRVGAVYLLAPDDAFWYLLLHCLLDRRSVPLQDAERLLRLAFGADGGGPVAGAIAPYLPSAWSPARVLGHARRAEWSVLATLGRRLRARRLRRHPVTASSSILLGRVCRHRATTGGRPGISVTLLGLDGAGKSTLAKGLQDSFLVPTRSMYMGPYPASSFGASRHVPGLGLTLRLLRLWSRSAAVAYHKARARLVVLDRYVLDVLLPPPGHAGLRTRTSNWVLRHALPAVDVVVLLDVPAEIAAQRKNEHTLAWLAERRRQYLDLARRSGGWHVVDASRDPEQVRRTVTAIVWHCYSTRKARGGRASPR
jgi:thymidylate kinase